MRRQRRRRHRRSGPGLEAKEPPRPVPFLTDVLLEEIFLRIGSPVDLARASAACVSFHRLIANPPFLRRYRSLHPPVLLGLLDPEDYKLEPAEAPHPSAALAGAVARAADFKFYDYLPCNEESNCYVCDVRDGRVLLMWGPEGVGKILPDLAVYYPLARRSLVLPPVPEDVLASAEVEMEDLEHFYARLVPLGDEEDDTSFRVVAMTNFTEMVAAFIFSSATGNWSAGSPVSLDDQSIPLDDPPSYAYGCFYWNVDFENELLKLDMCSMELSIVDLPTGHDGSRVNIVEAGEGRLGMFNLINNGTSLCHYITTQIGGDMSDQWKMDRVITLPVGYHFCIHHSYEGHIFLFGYGLVDNACFTLEIKTLKIQKVCRRLRGVYPYFGFLPSMLQRRT